MCGARSAPNFAEEEVSGTERVEAQASRSMHTIHVLAPSWPDVAERLRPIVTRAGAPPGASADAASARDEAPQGAPQGAPHALVLVPAARDVVALAAALRAVAPDRPEVGPLASVRRARRLVASAPPAVAVATPGVALALLRASALSLAGVRGAALVAADELAADRAALEAVLAELPRGIPKVLTCSAVTPFVEELAAAHFHGARRLDGPRHHAAPVDGPPIEVLPVAAGAPVGALADVLELVDAPSGAVVPGAAVPPGAAQQALTALGYPEASPLARVVPDGATGAAALVVLLGAPSAAQLGAVRAATPARIVALLTTRERAALASVPAAGPLVPFAPAPSRDDAAAAEESLRDRIRREVRSQLPAREMLALEPLLEEFDALTVAGAILRMHEARATRAPRPAEAMPPVADRPPRQGSGVRQDDDRAARRGGSYGGPRSADTRGRDRSDRGGPRRDARAGDRGGPRDDSDFRGRGPRKGPRS